MMTMGDFNGMDFSMALAQDAEPTPIVKGKTHAVETRFPERTVCGRDVSRVTLSETPTCRWCLTWVKP